MLFLSIHLIHTCNEKLTMKPPVFPILYYLTRSGKLLYGNWFSYMCSGFKSLDFAEKVN